MSGTPDLEAKRDSLYRRLEAGYSKIDEGLRAKADQNTVQKWEDFWIDLLHEYESVCRELQRDLAV